MMYGWIGLIVGGTVFGLMFLLIFILSFFANGRKMADKLFRLSESTKLEKFKKVIDNKLKVIKTELVDVKSHTDDRLNNIEAILKTLKKPKRDRRNR